MHAHNGYIRMQHLAYRLCIHACAGLCSTHLNSSLCALLALLLNPAIAQISTPVYAWRTPAKYFFPQRIACTKPELITLTTDILMSDQQHCKESKQHPKWVQGIFAAFAEGLDSLPGCSEAIEEHGLCVYQEAREGPFHFGCEGQHRCSCCKGAAEG